MARFEQELLIDALQHAHGNMLQAARDLQVSYRIVNYKVKKYNIDPRSFALARQGNNVERIRFKRIGKDSGRGNVSSEKYPFPSLSERGSPALSKGFM